MRQFTGTTLLKIFSALIVVLFSATGKVQAATPVLTKAEGTYPAGVQVSVVFQPNLTYRYTLTGAEVTASSPQLTGAQTLSTSKTLRVRAFSQRGEPGTEVRANYIITPTKDKVSSSAVGGSSAAPSNAENVAVTSASVTEQVLYLHTDVLGSVVAESDSSGQLKTSTQYKPFGEVVNN